MIRRTGVRGELFYKPAAGVVARMNGGVFPNDSKENKQKGERHAPHS